MKYTITVTHAGLGKSKVITHANEYIAREKAAAQESEWEFAWQKQQEIQQAKAAKIAYQRQCEQNAIDRTTAALEIIAALQSILSNAKTIALPPIMPMEQPVYLPYPPPPNKEAAQHFVQSQLSFLGRLFVEKRKNQEEKEFARMMDEWLNEKKRIDAENTRQNKVFVLHNQEINNAKAMYANYQAGEPEAVCNFFNKILNLSHYFIAFPRQWTMNYDTAQKTLNIDYQLPYCSDIPKLKEVKYIPSKDEFKELFTSDREWKSLYESVVYQITLRTLYELFTSDHADVVDTIVFNGIVHAIDKASGHLATECVLSLQVDKDIFLGIKLEAIDPKICIKQLSNSHYIQPIKPVLRAQHYASDSRFIEAYSIVNRINETTNLAAMDWEDFEHLVREIFEKEFLPSGGEVHLTQASRDGGVDAVVFDPDPIRGGKIVIQAKRYTKVVNVSAVRDLYGTVMNEGANKGILITTAHFGNDSYDFAKGKPLTLINGENLLSLLAKHGHKATIDTKAARLKSKQIQGRYYD